MKEKPATEVAGAIFDEAYFPAFKKRFLGFLSVTDPLPLPSTGTVRQSRGVTGSPASNVTSLLQVRPSSGLLTASYLNPTEETAYSLGYNFNRFAQACTSPDDDGGRV
ncbi:hypothetical protein DPEC_G00211970 [Dallia pectoralis]|uniref:Uncharacterized protein n=1 Tax=Dallia pectoralis TaxID=75939 RepID=A0ACC2G6D2_DALPE|nr:hypothetical protein DPEC_G00211970 [Dallia pectoralis]